MDLKYKSETLPEIQFGLLLEIYASHQALLRLFIKYSSKSDDQFEEMHRFYWQVHSEEYNELKEKLYTDYGCVDVSLNKESKSGC